MTSPSHGTIYDGGDADVHRWLVQQGAYSRTTGNVSNSKRERKGLTEKGRERERERERDGLERECNNVSMCIETDRQSE